MVPIAAVAEVMTGIAGLTVKVSAAVPVPVTLVAPMVTVVVPVTVGVPVMAPVLVLTAKPVGSPVAQPEAIYEDFTNLHVRLDPSQIRSVVSPPHKRGLFGDGNAPWRKKSDARNYLERLHRLYALLP